MYRMFSYRLIALLQLWLVHLDCQSFIPENSTQYFQTSSTHAKNWQLFIQAALIVTNSLLLYYPLIFSKSWVNRISPSIRSITPLKHYTLHIRRRVETSRQFILQIRTKVRFAVLNLTLAQESISVRIRPFFGSWNSQSTGGKNAPSAWRVSLIKQRWRGGWNSSWLHRQFRTNGEWGALSER